MYVFSYYKLTSLRTGSAMFYVLMHAQLEQCEHAIGIYIYTDL